MCVQLSKILWQHWGYLHNCAMRLLIILLLLLVQTGCATSENNYDPLEPMNRKVDTFNTGLDEAVLRPVSKGYTALIAKDGRNMVTNFFENLSMPNTILNDFLQGKVNRGLKDVYRLVVNSTIGVAGLFDVAASMGIEKHREDFGQTLAVWGVDQGAYIVYPVLGPNSVRNTPGTIMEYLLDGSTYLTMVMSPDAALATLALKYIDERANIEEFVQLRDEMALDAYVFVREGWRQSREYRIYDGNPPPKPESKTDDEDDPFADDEFSDDEFDD